MIPNWLRQRAHLTPNRLAIITSNATLTFRELQDRAAEQAGQLAAAGVCSGDRVALLLNNRIEFVVLMHAINLLGAVLVPMNTRLSSAEIAWQLGDVGASLMICDDSTADTADAAARERAGSLIEMTSPADVNEVKTQVRFDLNAVHSIVYTSGTTGRPKGALLTYGNFWWSSVGSALNLGHHLNDRWLAALPLFHVGGLSIAIKSVIYGIPMVLHQEFDPAAVNRSVDEDGVTIISAVAVMLARLLEERGNRPYPSSLRCVLLGGGPAPRSLLEQCVEGGIPVMQTYGLTEAASQVATLPPEDALRKLGSAGKPLMPTELRIVRDGQIAGYQETGEIVVRGPSISPGYLHAGNTAAGDQTMAKYDDTGWLHTGDIGYLDEEGYLYVLDRRDDLIVTGGENVYPAEVEAALLTHPEVIEAGVVGIPDETWGFIPVAAVKLQTEATSTPGELQTFVGNLIARYKIPKQIRIVDSLPRNAAGKLVRRRLLDSWQQTNMPEQQ